MAMGASLWTVPGLFAEELVKTPRQTEGPFYPDKLPLDTDNDLLIVNDKITPEFVNIPKSKLNELAAKFDVVLGVTPELD